MTKMYIILFLLFGIAGSVADVYAQPTQRILYNPYKPHLEADICVMNSDDFGITYIGSTETNAGYTFQNILLTVPGNADFVPGSLEYRFKHKVGTDRSLLRLFAMTQLSDGNKEELTNNDMLVLCGYIKEDASAQRKLILIWCDMWGVYLFSKTYELVNTPMNIHGLSIVATGPDNTTGLMIAGAISSHVNTYAENYDTKGFVMTTDRVGNVIASKEFESGYWGNASYDDYDMINRIVKYDVSPEGCKYALLGRANPMLTAAGRPEFKNKQGALVMSIEEDLTVNWYNVYEDPGIHKDIAVDIIDNDQDLILLSNSSNDHTYYLTKVDKTTGALSDFTYFATAYPKETYGYSLTQTNDADAVYVSGIKLSDTPGGGQNGSLFLHKIDRPSLMLTDAWLMDITGAQSNNIPMDYYSGRWLYKHFFQEIMYYDESKYMPVMVAGVDLVNSGNIDFTGKEAVRFTENYRNSYEYCNVIEPVMNRSERELEQYMITVTNTPIMIDASDIIIEQETYTLDAIECERDYVPTSGEPDTRKSMHPGADEYDVTTVYPNPASEYIYVTHTSPLKSVRIYNVIGKLLYESTQTDVEKVYVGLLPAGTYIMHIETGSSTIQKKVEIFR